MPSYRSNLWKDETPCLYRHYDTAGRILYIGITDSLFRRIKEHQRSFWFPQITRIEIERFPTYDAVRDAEYRAIRVERPLYNGETRETEVGELIPIPEEWPLVADHPQLEFLPM